MEDLDFFNDHAAFHKREQLKAMDIAADGLIRLAERYCQKAKDLAEKETDPTSRTGGPSR